MEVMTLHPDITIGQGVVMEAWLTFILMQTIWGSINSKRRRVLSPSIPIGLAYVVDILAGVRTYYSITILHLQHHDITAFLLKLPVLSPDLEEGQMDSLEPYLIKVNSAVN